MNRDPRLLLMINRLPGHCGRRKHRLLENCRDGKDFAAQVPAYLSQLSARIRRRCINLDQLGREVDVELRHLHRWSINYTVLGDSDYPCNLRHIADPPFLLYFRGRFPHQDKPPIAIVGTRRPTPEGKRDAYRLALEFSLSAYPVVSGLAFGIDRSAHEGAMAGCGVTWAVLAGGLDAPGPRSHRRLAGRILDTGGALVGEIPPGMFPAKYAFPRRNRILSGLCRGCIVVQAPMKSGALITANFALEQNRDLFVCSAGMEGPASSGTRNLEAQGAPVVRSAADILGDWGRFTDIRKVRNLSEPQSGHDLVQMLKSELKGQLYQHMGGWFEHRGT